MNNIGYNVKGVEYNNDLIFIGKENVVFYGIDCDIRSGDFLDDSVVPRIEEYDLVTCNDVIEHILDPRAAIRKIYDILKPGGYAFIETVNKRSIINVRTEIHSGLFGISLLDHHSSNAAYKEYHKSNSELQISDFYYLEWYMNLARSCGGIVQEVSGPNESPSFEEELKKFWAAYDKWREVGRKNLSFFSIYEIEKEVFKYSSEFFSNLAAAHQEQSFVDFNRRWVDPIIRFTIYKPMK